MEGNQFVIDERGEKTAVLIDLKKCSDLWEDFYHNMLAQQRAAEPRESLQIERAKLRQQEILSG